MKRLSLILLLFIVALPVVFSADDALTNTIGALTMPETITAPMGAWEKFINAIEVIGLHIGFWLLVLLYIALITLLVYLPIKMYPFIKQHQNLLRRLLDLRLK
jgi:hypothetical protein